MENSFEVKAEEPSVKGMGDKSECSSYQIQQKKSKKTLFVVSGIILLVLMGWVAYSLVSFINSVHAYENQEMTWRTQATQYINILVQYDSQQLAAKK
jgi:hypothetical protein